MTSRSHPAGRQWIDVESIDLWWRAANYLSVGQIYLVDNPLLREPLRLEHVKRRLLGHWGTSPGLNFVYLGPGASSPKQRASSGSISAT